MSVSEDQFSDRAKSIFLSALEIESDSERRAFIEAQCAGHELLCQEVERLLNHQHEVGSFLESPPPGVGPGFTPTVLNSTTETAGGQIGPYKLLQELGEGGMGVVYLAERQHPVKQRVALKIIKHGRDSKQFISRFESERQALAMMDHPNIAKVLDAGCTDNGRPYFVMELVKGVPISNFCDENRLTTRERLELFIQVCQAVHHAHQKGIIHRDLKPSNVLVALYDDKPVPKVIDFGVAKATNQQLTEKTLFTEVGSILGTWEYMSPEQAVLNQLDVDTRTDVYSLGVLLYELLTGETPLDRQRLHEAQILETLRIIREEEPPKPSTRVSGLGEKAPTMAAYRKSKPETLASEIRGDLDWIVMKALAKERARRYDSASRFAEDIERHLQNELVEARPPSMWYQVRKFYLRNKSLALSMVAIIVALTLGLLIALRGLRRESIAYAALEREQQNVVGALDALGEAAMKLALQHALNGNSEETEEALLIASGAQVEEDRITLLRACLELYGEEHRYEMAMNKLKKLIATNDQNVAARALFANAILWSGKSPPEQHYDQLEVLQKAISDMEKVREYTIEEKVFLGQAIGRIDPEKAIAILRWAVEDSGSPVARLLLSQALSDHADDTHNGELAIEAYKHASAAHLSLPNSSMANALCVWASHIAWRLNKDKQAQWYLEEARQFSESINRDSTAVERAAQGWFLAEDTANEEYKHNDWSMIEDGVALRGPAPRILWHSPDRYDELVEVLEPRLSEDKFRWYGASASLMLLNALSPDRHSIARRQIDSLDLSKQVYFAIDPRVYALAAALIMDGCSSDVVVRIASELRSNAVQSHDEPIGLAEYALGELSEAEFIKTNNTRRGRWCNSELFVALAYIGERDKVQALRHLEKSVEADGILGMHWWALALRDLLRNDHPLLAWVVLHD